MSVSVGVAAAHGGLLTATDLLHRADLEMFRVKRSRSACSAGTDETLS